jgi:hypothetical protein
MIQTLSLASGCEAEATWVGGIDMSTVKACCTMSGSLLVTYEASEGNILCQVRARTHLPQPLVVVQVRDVDTVVAVQMDTYSDGDAA